MQLDVLKSYIAMGREIEFSYQGEMYSITYIFDNNVQTISFCCFAQPCVNYHTTDELIDNAIIGNQYLRDILKDVEDVIVY